MLKATQHIWRNNRFAAWRPNAWDFFALLLVFLLLIGLAWGTEQMRTPYRIGQALPITLAASHLPIYALQTVMRLLLAMVLSLLITFIFGTLAAKNRHAERVIIPLVDILQSVPILGFLSITVAGFIALFPNSLLGPECAAIFVIFTSQVWNMLLSFYQSLCSVPAEMREAAAVFQLSSWQRFWRIEVPFAMPSLVWNMMLSMSASWFFVVASEAISVNNQNILLPGIGSYIATAIRAANKDAIFLAVITMLVVIVLYDQLLFRPLVCWAEKFKIDFGVTDKSAKSWLVNLLRRTRLLHYCGQFLGAIFQGFTSLRTRRVKQLVDNRSPMAGRGVQLAVVSVWYMLLLLVCIVGAFALLHFIFQQVSVSEALQVVLLGVYTAIRVFLLIAVCSLVWVPVGIWIGMNDRVRSIAQPLVQILAAFPANLIFPVVVFFIISFHLNVNIWVTPLMILGAQWYILFNVIAGASSIPKDLHYAVQNFGVSNWLWWKRFVLPAIFPFYITGAITAAGGAWNASIIAEVVSWGHTTLYANGLGAYIKEVTTRGDFPRIALGIAIMCIFILVFNRLLWQPLYNIAQKRYTLS